jgi:1,4-dihydroxy-2-naphthoyl-CoA hydrolase
MSTRPLSSASALLDSMPFARLCGIELVEADPTRVTGRLAWAPERCTASGVMHGAAIMALADSLGGACAAHACTHPLHVGRSTIVVQTDVTDDEGRPVAQVTQTQIVLG